MPTKTEAELEAEIKNLKGQLKDKRKDKQYDDFATQVATMYKSFVKAGFTEEQAWELTKNIVNNSTAPQHSIFKED